MLLNAYLGIWYSVEHKGEQQNYHGTMFLKLCTTMNLFGTLCFRGTAVLVHAHVHYVWLR